MGRSANCVLSISLLIFGLGLGRLEAQAYQSSFSEVKFDRSKTPGTFHGELAVEIPTGAANLTMPLGPGIGARGASFTPVLSFRMSPQARIFFENNWRDPSAFFTDYSFLDYSASREGYGQWQALLTQSSFGSASLNAGTFDLAFNRGTNPRQSAYDIPGFGGGTILGDVPSGTAPLETLAVFGISGYQISRAPSLTTASSAPNMIWLSTNGDLVIGLSSGNDPMDTIQWNPVESGTPETGPIYGRFPRMVAVVRGDTAFLFEFLHPNYRTIPIPSLTTNNQPDGKTKVPLDGAHYRLVRISNRFGESIRFSYESDGFGFTGEWWRTSPTGVKVEVRIVGPAELPISGQPSLRNGMRGQVSAASRISVRYLGISPAPAVIHLDASTNTGDALWVQTLGTTAGFRGLDRDFWDATSQQLQPLKITLEEAQPQSLTFKYALGPNVQYEAQLADATVLDSITYSNGRQQKLTWAPYHFVENQSPEHWAGIRGIDAYCWGVTVLLDTDSRANSTRTTLYDRVVPEIPVRLLNTPYQEQWISKNFYTVVTHPDGLTTLHRFTSPSDDFGAIDGSEGMRNLGFLKHVEVETRSYPIGMEWKSDLRPTNGDGKALLPIGELGTASSIVISDRFSLRGLGNPSGLLSKQSVPYPTRTRSWDKATQIWKVQEKRSWDTTAFGWGAAHDATGASESPALTFDLLEGGAVTTLPGLAGENTTTYTLESLPAKWLMARSTGESTTASDQTPSHYDALGRASTRSLPTITRSLNASFNRIQWSQTGDLRADFSFTSDEGPGASLPNRVSLSGAGLINSGLVGATYTYDELGSLASITQQVDESRALIHKQEVDPLGRTVKRIDPNGLETVYGWDEAGRMKSVLPPGEFAVSYAVDPDHRGIQITRGEQHSQLRYNAFGDLVQERRQDGSGKWSYRTFGIDAGGRKVGETVWNSGLGDDHEHDWTLPNLTRSITVQREGNQICCEWGLDPSGAAVCLRWGAGPPITITTPKAFDGTSIEYDALGRVVRTVGADGLVTTTDYDHLLRTVAVDPQGKNLITKFQSDPLGRLVQVMDAVGYATNYFYELTGKRSKVEQGPQIRTWAYDDHGWLISTSQPETGPIAFSRFDVLGKAWTENRNGREVRRTYDAIGRLRSVAEGDGAAFQTFTYDSGEGLGLGKLAEAIDDQVSLSYGYETANGGRLKQLNTRYGGNIFTQSFGYDGYGQRVQAQVGDRNTTTTFDNARGLPKLVTHQGNTVASAAYEDPGAPGGNPAWNLLRLNFGQGSAFTNFSHYPDQVRLQRMTHVFTDANGGQSLSWDYKYDSAGRLVGDGEDIYMHDNLNRLIGAQVRRPNGQFLTHGISYDRWGNLLGIQAGGDTTSVKTAMSHQVSDENFSDLAQFNRMPRNTRTGAAYDDQGNLLQAFITQGSAGDARTMSYDALGRMSSMTDGNTGIREVYRYTPDALLTAIEEWNGTVLQRVRINLYNDQRQLVSQWVME